MSQPCRRRKSRSPRVDFEPAEALAIGKRASTLLGGETAEFNERYVPVLQRDTDVAIGHAALRKALAKLAAQGGE